MRILICLATILFFISIIAAQTPDIDSLTSSRERLKARSKVSQSPFVNIGPTVQSGRVSAIAVNPENPHHFYVAYASGGLWVTHNNGTSFNPLFDHEAVMTIGALEVDWNSGKIWLGTGEVNSSRSSYAGLGIYSSSDKGTSWNYRGLPESHHIGKIIALDSMTAIVGVLGHLYTQNPERGIYKTTDGGNSWKQTLSINDSTGVVDIIRDPRNKQVLYAASWQRDRKAWNFIEAGAGSGICKSSDAGNSWELLTTTNSGFPTHDQVGRIGLSATAVEGELTLYAFLDNYARRADKNTEGLTDKIVSKMSKTAFLNYNEKRRNDYIKSLNLPKKYTTQKLIDLIKKDAISPEQLSSYNKDANRLLFDTPVIGAELYKSTDEGKTWSKTHEGSIDGIYYSYGYYFGQVRSNPTNAEELYIMGVPILKSKDGGKSFSSVNGDNVHVDHHALWINPENTDHLINGNDGGVNISYDGGENWIKCNTPSVGQFYSVNVDSLDNYNVYGGLQDNGVWKGNHNYKASVRWHQTGEYPYKMIMGGDGMQIQIDPRDPDLVYTGYQFGNYFRINQSDGTRQYITPKHDLGEAPYRWNWQSPILISPHNADIIYLGANKLFRSFDKGDHFEAISDDLSYGGRKGDVPYGTLTTIAESPFNFGKLYTGSDDGKVYRSTNGGKEWENISPAQSKDLWVSRVICSAHDKHRVYLSLNGYRNDDFAAYLYRSDDGGDTWTNIATTLPTEPINVVKEDPNDEDIIYVGTDHGTYLSLDKGSTFMTLAADIPRVPVHDVVIHKQQKDLIIATHGRSLYRVNVAHLSQLKDIDQPVKILADIRQRYKPNAGQIRNSYSEAMPFEVDIDIYSDQNRTSTIQVKTEKGSLFIEQDMELKRGINQISLGLKVDQSRQRDFTNWLKSQKLEDQYKLADDGNCYLVPGKYQLSIKNSTDNHRMLIIK